MDHHEEDLPQGTQIRWEDRYGMPQGTVLWGGDPERNALETAVKAERPVRYRVLDADARALTVWMALYPCRYCLGSGWYQAVPPELAHTIYPRKVYACYPCDGSGLDPEFHKVEIGIEPDTDTPDEEPWEGM